MKSLINKQRKTQSVNTKFLINGKIVENDELVSKAFNDFFTNVGPTLDAKIPKSNINPLKYIKKSYSVNMYVTPCGEEEVTKLIGQLKEYFKRAQVIVIC